MSERPRCLVGMSGVGKSHVSRALRGAGFTWHDCDRAIALELGELVVPEPGEEPVHALGRWMGMPWTAGYAEREARYLRLEEEVTRTALERAIAAEGPQVIDTTGSVVYLSEPLRASLRAHCDVIYLRAPLEEHARMLELYLREPKPVVWGGLFATFEGEHLALPHAYPALLAERDTRYLALAHRWLDARELGAADSIEHALERARPT